jgi:4-hydroxythreonine-4-phosphate dehydrogenase
MKPLPVLGLTMGDPAGIGPEICLRALCEPSVLAQCVPVLFGDAAVIDRLLSSHSHSHSYSLSKQSKSKSGSGSGSGSGKRKSRFRIISLKEWSHAPPAREPLIVDCAAIDAKRVHPGKISAACGRAGFIFIEQAIRSALRGQLDGVVTAPIHKEALQLSGVKHPGHTEIFTALTRARRSCMMLRSDVLTVSMVTTHIGYAEVPEKLSVARVLDVIELTAEAMARMLKRTPRLAICGLNPHAGEHGLFGRREEERFIKPAIARARRKGIHIEGPLPPDAAFTTGQRKRFDAIVTLYHDQGHIPFKMLAFDTGVNVTLGLPIVRTSVDHGTAFDIAWQGVADPRSLFEAIRVAVDLTRGRKNNSTAKNAKIFSFALFALFAVQHLWGLT